MIFDEFLVNFPFTDPRADRANALGFLVTPFVRRLIKSPIPLGVVNAPVQGSGKGLLAQCLALPAVGQASVISPPDRDEEWKKTITSILSEKPLIALIDNLTQCLKSPHLAAVLTALVWKDRILGKSEMITLPNLCTWLATANNLSVNDDHLRRIVWIFIDPQMERPSERPPGSFKHEPLIEWGLQNRGRLVWAALVFGRAWINAGMPLGARTMGSFESWARVVGGILQVANVEGFLENQQKRRDSSNEESEILESVLSGLV